MPDAPGVAERMGRIDAVKKGVDVDAVFQERLGQTAHDTEALLDRLLAAAPVEGERARPRRLLDAMRYSSLGGGKRLRPFLVVESRGAIRRRAAIRADGGRGAGMRALLFARSRRSARDGQRRPATRPADRAQGVRRGDRHPGRRRPSHLGLRYSRPPGDASRCRGQARAGAGAGARVRPRRHGGRTNARPGGGRPVRRCATQVRRARGEDAAGDEDGRALALRLSAGAILGKASQSQRTAFDRYGSALGEAFQIADDLLDLEGDPATVGKATGKDAAAHKATLVGVLGPAAARRRLDSLVAEAQAALGPSAMLRMFSRRRRASSRRATLERKSGRRRGLVQLGGLEPPTSWSTARRSNQLSYSCTRGRKRAQTRSTVPL